MSLRFLTPLKGGAAAPFSNLYSIALNGSSYVSYSATATNYEYTQPFTLNAWVYQTDQTNYASVFSNCNTSGVGIALAIQGGPGGVLLFVLRNSLINRAYAFGTIPIVINTWNMVTATSDGTGTVAGMKLYVNGVADTVSLSYDDLASNTIVSNAAMTIGTNLTTGLVQYFVGNIDEASIWNSVQSSATISGWYNGGTPTNLAGAPNLGPWWRFENNYNDSNGTNNGTNTGTTFSTNVP